MRACRHLEELLAHVYSSWFVLFEACSVVVSFEVGRKDAASADEMRAPKANRGRERNIRRASALLPSVICADERRHGRVVRSLRCRGLTATDARATIGLPWLLVELL